jgi:UTP-glucose-1-phosphate uridylyltransferase
LGTLMKEAQDNFDQFAIPACPEELEAPVLHRILNYPPLLPYIWGGKGVGSQGDGTAQFIARSKVDQENVVSIIENDLRLPCMQLTIHSGPKVKKALIPAAGFGTRLFPASKATKKELFPIVDRDGIAKPAILLIVEEALDAGIDEVIIIVQETDLNEFNSFFNDQITIENFNKLSKQFQDYSRRILEIGQHVKFMIQKNQEGFGHAIYCAKESIGNEPFLLMLGDHIYRSNSEISCARQLVDAYQQHGTSVVGLRSTPESFISNFGTITGIWLEDRKLLSVSEFSEKPNLDYARSNLRIPGLAEDEYMTVFGQYIIKPGIFDYLEENIRNNFRERGEFQLTSALDRMRRENGFLGLVIDGQRFDIGLPDYYLDTLQAYRRD